MLSLLVAAVLSVPGGEIRGPAWLSRADEKPKLTDQHVVFVAGFMNEVIPGYFDDNREALHGAGGTSCLIFPSSAQHLEEDVEALKRSLETHPETGVTLFGHSKGGAAVLLTVLKHPELVLSGKVRSVVVVQGAIGGSPLADMLTFVGKKKKDGLHSLKPAEAKALFDGARAELAKSLTKEQLAELSSHVFYVRAKHRKLVAAELAATAAILDGKGENDGLVPLGDQKLEDFGVDLGVLESDHSSLTVAGVLSVSSPADRRSFTLALFNEINRQLAQVSKR